MKNDYDPGDVFSEWEGDGSSPMLQVLSVRFYVSQQKKIRSFREVHVKIPLRVIL